MGSKSKTCENSENAYNWRIDYRKVNFLGLPFLATVGCVQCDEMNCPIPAVVLGIEGAMTLKRAVLATLAAAGDAGVADFYSLSTCGLSRRLVPHETAMLYPFPRALDMRTHAAVIKRGRRLVHLRFFFLTSSCLSIVFGSLPWSK